MYYCEICQQLANPGTPSYRIVVATRPVEYPYRRNANRNPRTHRHRGAPKILTPSENFALFKLLQRVHDPVDDPGGHGWEIAKEPTVCPACAAAWHASHPPQRATLRPKRE